MINDLTNSHVPRMRRDKQFYIVVSIGWCELGIKRHLDCVTKTDPGSDSWWCILNSATAAKWWGKYLCCRLFSVSALPSLVGAIFISPSRIPFYFHTRVFVHNDAKTSHWQVKAATGVQGPLFSATLRNAKPTFDIGLFFFFRLCSKFLNMLTRSTLLCYIFQYLKKIIEIVIHCYHMLPMTEN